jgi:DNA-binding transcriptional LysR family regulator
VPCSFSSEIKMRRPDERAVGTIGMSTFGHGERCATLSRMDVDSLRCFEAAATTLHFRAAAARVHLSPAAFSDRLARLEESLGAGLFRRTSRKVELTDVGRRLLPEVRDVLARMAGLGALAREDRGPPPYDLVIGTRYELGLSWLCPSLSALERTRPERTLHLYNGDTPDLMTRLERGDLDAVVHSARLTSSNLTYAALHEEQYAFVGVPGIRVRGPDDARSLVLVDVTGDLPLFRYFLDATSAITPWPFRRVERMGGIGAIRRRVLDGGRVAVLPAYFVAADLKAGRLVSLMKRVKPRSDAFRLVYRTGQPREREILALAAELRRIPLR